MIANCAVIDLERKIEELKTLSGSGATDFGLEISRLEKKARRLQSEIFSELSRWQVTQLSWHPARPYFLDYVELLFTDAPLARTVAARDAGLPCLLALPPAE